jgi:hypothetical protein
MSYLRYTCMCVVFLRIVVSKILCFCFVCLRLVCPVLPVSLDCPILIALSEFSNVYLQFLWIVLF